MTFQAKVTTSKAKDFIGLNGPQMKRIADAVLISVKQRIGKALDTDDRPAPPLKNARYAKSKERRNIPGVRNWRFSGLLMNSMQVMSAGPNKATIGFVERAYNLASTKKYATTNLVAYLNNQKWEQFGVSPRDAEVLKNAAERELTVSVMAKAS